MEKQTGVYQDLITFKNKVYVLNLLSQRLFYGFPKLILPSFLPIKIQGAAGAYRGGNDCD